jgi:hypothetical protein
VACTLTRTCTYARTHTLTHEHIHTQTHRHTDAHADTHRHTRTRTHTYAYAHIYVHINIRTHARHVSHVPTHSAPAPPTRPHSLTRITTRARGPHTTTATHATCRLVFVYACACAVSRPPRRVRTAAIRRVQGAQAGGTDGPCDDERTRNCER